DRPARGQHSHRPVLLAGGDYTAKETLDVVRQSAGGDVVVAGLDPANHVAHASANQEGLKAVVFKARHDIEDGLWNGHLTQILWGGEGASRRDKLKCPRRDSNTRPRF